MSKACSNCGTLNPDLAVRCVACSEPFPKAASSLMPPTAPASDFMSDPFGRDAPTSAASSYSRRSWIGAIVIAAVLALGAAWWFGSSHDALPSPGAQLPTKVQSTEGGSAAGSGLKPP